MSEAPWTVVFAEDAINDLVLITEYLTQAYCSFGEPLAEANRHAQLRIEAGNSFKIGEYRFRVRSLSGDGKRSCSLFRVSRS